MARATSLGLRFVLYIAACPRAELSRLRIAEKGCVVDRAETAGACSDRPTRQCLVEPNSSLGHIGFVSRFAERLDSDEGWGEILRIDCIAVV